MTNRTTHFGKVFKGDKSSQTQPRRLKLFQHYEDYPFHSLTIRPSSLYLACQNNDLAGVESCLKQMTYAQIDCQCPPNNETALHIATRNQHKEIIKILLLHGAQRSLRNTDGQQAHELAEGQKIKHLFQRLKSFRFMFLHNCCQMPILFQRETKFKSCSLINDNTFYEWELIDRNPTKKALRFHHDLKSSKSMNDKILKQKLYSIKKGYLPARLQDVHETDSKRIYEYFNRALLRQEPEYIITACTTSQTFTELLNKDMARNVIHDLKNGCSKFSCDCLYSTEDGTKSITSILLQHPNFKKFIFQGEVYRGMVLHKDALRHYKVGSCIITTTFLATSKNPTVARCFCDIEKVSIRDDDHSFFCIFQIVNDNRTALDISSISEYEDEDEVLIMPYSAFFITKIEEDQEITNIFLKEQQLTHMFGNNNSQEYSIKSPTHLLEVVENNLSHNADEILLQETDNITLQSKTMAVLSTRF